LKFLTVQSIDEALEVLARHGANVTLLAGGTDVMIQLERCEIETDMLLHLERLDELRNIELKNTRVEIGSLATHRRLATNALLADDYESIRSAAASVGGWQTQSVGTIGGNICNASPAADLIPPLLVHGAKVKLSSHKRGERTLPLSGFLLGRRRTARNADELLTQISLEVAPVRTADVYLKVGRRGAMEVAIVGLALRLTMSDDQSMISDVRIATCATGPIPMRADAAEALLIGQHFSTDLLRAAGEALVDSVVPIDDVRGSAAYRLMVLPRLLERAARICKETIETRS